MNKILHTLLSDHFAGYKGTIYFRAFKNISIKVINTYISFVENWIVLKNTLFLQLLSTKT